MLNDKLDVALGIGLVGLWMIGPWSTLVARVLELGVYERISVADMARDLVPAIFPSLLRGAAYFLVPPVLCIGLRAWKPRIANAFQLLVLALASIASVVTWPLFWVRAGPDDRSSGDNYMGQVLSADLFTLWGWHAFLALTTTTQIPPATLPFGPALGLAWHLTKSRRLTSLWAGVAALYVNVAAIYTAHAKMQQNFGVDTLNQTIALNEWRGYELFAAVQVIAVFLAICVSLPVPRRILEGIETVFYIVLLNGNVAAAWAASTGIWRQPLVIPDLEMLRSIDPRFARPVKSPPKRSGIGRRRQRPVV